MKPLSIAILLLAASTASSFVANRSPAMKTSVLRSTGDLEGMWEELKKTERDIIVQTAVDEQEDTGQVGEILAEKLLETALEYVKTKEHNEEEKVLDAHKAFEHAVEEEKVLEEFVMEDQLNDIPADSYVEERLHAAHDAEIEARKEEEAHLKKAEEWHKEEEAVEEVLEELWASQLKT